MEELIRAWVLALSPSGDDERLRHRWRTLGWTEAAARERLAQGELFPVRNSADVATLRQFADGGGIAELPFGELFGRIAASAMGDLPAVVERVLSLAAREAARRDIAKSLAMEAAPALAAKLRPHAALAGTARSEPHERFVEHLLAGGWAAFLDEHPVLARQLALRIENGRAMVCEFAQRCEADAAVLDAAFGVRTAWVEALEFDLGDTHRRGRKVIGVQFAGDVRLIYKPRSLKMDVAWRALLDGMALSLRAPQALDRGTHGWVERVEPGAPDDAREYYHRAGQLLAVAWACGGSDFHEENVIATAGGPVLVDLETLFTPLVRPFGMTDDDLHAMEADEVLSDSVLTSLLLPVWKFENDGRARDMSGFGGMDRAAAGWSEPQWIDMGTDAVREVMSPVATRYTKNVPRDASGRLLAASAYAAAIVDGYREAARVLVECRETLPLAAFRSAEIRFLTRSSEVYWLLLRRLRQPQFLRSETARAVEVEKLARAYLPPDATAPRPAVMDVYDAERAAIDSGDIPLFTAAIESRDLHGDGRAVVRGYFWRSGWDVVQRRLARADETFVEREAALIRASLDLRNPAPVPRTNGLLDVAVSIADDLAARTVPLPTGGVGWLAPVFDPVRRVQVSGVLGMDLYGGGLGVGIFLAGLARTTGESRWADLAREATLPRLRSLRSALGTRDVSLLPCGIGSGTGSFVYGALVMAGLTEEEEYLDLARTMGAWVSAREDRIGDILAGAAGGILALLALGGDEALDRARALGRHLLGLRVPGDAGQRAWKPDFANAPLAGLGHGAAGCAWALRRLGEAVGEAAFIEAADEALAYEDTIFDADAGNWPDLRRGSASGAFMHGWCAGPAGAATARLAQFGGEPALISPAVEAALRDIRNGPQLAATHLCCGQTARIELLLQLGHIRQDAAFREEARTLAEDIVQARMSCGHFATSGGDRGRLFSPSFFQGSCGIGYTLLRVANASLPSVAALEIAAQ